MSNDITSQLNLGTPLLELQDVTAGAHGCPAALRGVSLTLNHHHCLAVIGPNGSGKSTLLRAIIGEIGLASGQILLDGRPLGSLSRQARARSIALLAQNDTPDLRLTVAEYVGLGRLPHYADFSARQHEEIVNQAIEDTGLPTLRRRLLGTLSGGELQRAGLARAFAQTPRVLLLDEPTNHLDPLARAQLLGLVRARGIATIAVLHDLTLIESFAERVAVLQHGRLVCCDTPERALVSSCIEPVFGMRSFTVAHPATGQPLKIFEASLRA
ncbi:ABC transporter ATP-binding protein [Sodalis sp. RH22]|uniref:ABC transporter ATP-binding protein n=1 Tax=unclassified Sodalis (in: enterobacteria) TaxID=2636512 RepID=UPI0039B58820